MKKFFTLVMLACMALVASAEDIGTWELGKAYLLPMFGHVTGTLKAEVTGDYIAWGTKGQPTNCLVTDKTDPDAKVAVTSSSYYGTPDGYGDYMMQGSVKMVLTAGHEYTVTILESSLENNSYCTILCEADLAFEVSKTDPAIGSEIGQYTNNSGDILVYFTKDVDYNEINATLEAEQYGAKDCIVYESGIGNNIITVRIGNAIRALYADGLKGGDKVTMKLTGVATANSEGEAEQINGNGEVELEYTAAAPAMKLLSVTPNPEHYVMESLYAENDQDAKFVFTFSENVGTKNFLMDLFVAWGDKPDTQAHMTLPTEINGNVVTVNLAGVQCSQEWIDGCEQARTYYPTEDGGYSPWFIGFKLMVYDEAGNPSEGNSDGSVGSYNYTWGWAQPIEPIDITFDWTPAEGSNLAEYDQVSVWLDQPANTLTTDGMLFKYAASGAKPRAAGQVVNEPIWAGSFTPSEATPYLDIEAEWDVIPVGAKIVLYAGEAADDAEAGLYTGGEMLSDGLTNFEYGMCEFTVTADMLEALQMSGLQVGGHDYTLMAVMREYEEVINYTEVLVPFAELTVNDEGGTAVEYTATVPDEAKGHPCIVTLANLVSSVDKQKHEEVMVEYKWLVSVEVAVTPEPGEVEEIGRIEILVDGNPGIKGEEPITLTYQAEGSDEVTELVSVGGLELYAEYAILDQEGFTCLGYFVQVNPATSEPGTYTLTVPADLFEFEDENMYNDEVVAVYTIANSGIKSIVVNGADYYEVYTVGGVKVMGTANASQLGTLAKGIYIINGVKTLVK